MAAKFIPILTSTDWNAEWRALQEVRRRADDASEWDKRAETYPVKHGEQTSYVERFIELAAIEPGETVLDMGCGTGSLATPLAQAGHRVMACDFSRGMLDMMERDQRELGVTGVEIRQMSWADDWGQFGLGENSVDVAIASRSIATSDLRESLMKLNHVARRRACITLPCGPSPRTDERLLSAVGLQHDLVRDFAYAFNILMAEGINPEVAYIHSMREESFATPEEAEASYTKLIAGAVEGIATQEEIDAIPKRLRPWLAENLVQSEHGLRLAQPRVITWAFIAWKTT